MKNKKLNNLFVGGKKAALVALIATSLIACNKEKNPYDADKTKGLAVAALFIGCLAAPGIISKVKDNHKNKQR